MSVCVLQHTLRRPSTDSVQSVLALNSHQAQPSILHPLLRLGLKASNFSRSHSHVGGDVTAPAE